MRKNKFFNALVCSRLGTNLTQEDVARQLRVPRSMVSRWETNRAMPRATTLKKLAQLYGCTVDDLLKEGSEISGADGADNKGSG